MRFTEVEHKFVVPPEFDLDAFRRSLELVGHSRHFRVLVRDRYYLTNDGVRGRYILRHRHDRVLQQLTIKSLEADAAIRDEINLDLGHHAGDQADVAEAFARRMGLMWSGTIIKDLNVWEFCDCEVVHYAASAGARKVDCVEFEAIDQTSLETALAVLARYERATGFEGAVRETQPLFELLFSEALSF